MTDKPLAELVLDLNSVPDDIRQKNDDWILSDAQRARELALFDRLEIADTVAKGGPGSGFTREAGHVGIPRHRGGSAHRGEAIGNLGDGNTNFDDEGQTIDAARNFLIHSLIGEKDRRSAAKEQLVAKLSSDTGESEQTVNHRVRAWAQSSSYDPISEIHQEAAAEAFGIEQSDWQEGDHEKLKAIKIYAEKRSEIQQASEAAMAYEEWLNFDAKIHRFQQNPEPNSSEVLWLQDAKDGKAMAESEITHFGLKIPGSRDEARWMQMQMDGKQTRIFQEAGLPNFSGDDFREAQWSFNDLMTFQIPVNPSAAKNQEFVKAVYKNTQDALKAAGIDHVTLYRGCARSKMPEGTSIGMGKTFDVKLKNENALTSWTTNRQTAVGFMGRGSTRGGFGVLMKMTVPISRIWSTARTGPGCLSEQEFIILSGDNDVANIKVTNL